MSPLVSIIIPTHDRVALLRATLASVCAQLYPHWECLVVDDASADGTAEAVEASARLEPRIRLLRRTGEKGGAQVCRNQGMAAARGEYYIFLDSDDLLAPFCLQQRVAHMQAQPDLAFAVFPALWFKETPGDMTLLQNTWERAGADLDRFLMRDIVWLIAGPIWRAKAFAALGAWDEALLSGQEWDVHLRAIMAKLTYAKVPQPDWFVRGAAARPTIGQRWFDPCVMQNRQAQIPAMARRLQAAGLLTLSRRLALRAGAFKEAFILSRSGCVRQAVRYWREVQCDPLLRLAWFWHALLQALLRVQGVRYVRGVSQRITLRFVPRPFRFALAVRPARFPADPACRALREPPPLTVPALGPGGGVLPGAGPRFPP
jgi:hypothetical protein